MDKPLGLHNSSVLNCGQVPKVPTAGKFGQMVVIRLVGMAGVSTLSWEEGKKNQGWTECKAEQP